MARVRVIQGHPDAEAVHFGHALAEAYAEGARAGGHDVRGIIVAALGMPVLAREDEWEHADPPAPIRRCQDDIAWAEHLVILFPLWLGGMRSAAQGSAGTDIPAAFRPRAGRRVRPWGRPAAQQDRPYRGDDGDAGTAVPPAFPRPFAEKPGTHHPALPRYRLDSRDRDRSGGGGRRAAAQRLLEQMRALGRRAG